MSLNYEDVVVVENSHKVYLCKLVEDDGELTYMMQVHDTNESMETDMVLYHYEEDSPKEYRKEDVLEIIEQVGVEMDSGSNYDDPDGEFPVDFEAIKHLHYEDDVYRFNNKDDLILLYKSMNDPMIAGVYGGKYYLKELDEGVFGVVYYWTEYDDWSCGHPYSYHMKIIFGVK